MLVVVMLSTKLCISTNIWSHVGLSEQIHLTIKLLQHEVPKGKWKIVADASKHPNYMRPECLDGCLGTISSWPIGTNLYSMPFDRIPSWHFLEHSLSRTCFFGMMPDNFKQCIRALHTRTLFHPFCLSMPNSKLCWSPSHTGQ